MFGALWRSGDWGVRRGDGKNYQVGDKLGAGAQASVYKAFDLNTGTVVAIKRIDLKPQKGERDKQIDIFRREAKNHWRMRDSPNIVRCREVFQQDNCLCIVMEFAEGGDLKRLLRQKENFPEYRAKHYFRQICAGVKALHDNGIVMRDIKLQNMVLDSSQEHLWLCDFGFSKVEAEGTSTYLGSPHYMSPELVLVHKGRGTVPYDGKAVDIWACGVSLYTMLYGRYPFVPNNMTLDNAILNQPLVFHEEQQGHTTLSEEVMYVLESMLNKDPARRATIEEILASEWLQED